MERLSGTVRWFSNVKGYGFLGTDNGPDVFVHHTAIEADGYRTLKEGQLVEFEIIQGEKGPQADHVRRFDAQSQQSQQPQPSQQAAT